MHFSFSYYYNITTGDVMLNINNKEDIHKMMQYHRTRDMINLITYFPTLSPIRNLTVVESIEDYLENYNFCKKLAGERNDTLITKPFMKSIERRGIDTDIINTFEEVKKLDSDGILVLFNLCNKPSERYAGISVVVSINNGVYIE